MQFKASASFHPYLAGQKTNLKEVVSMRLLVCALGPLEAYIPCHSLLLLEKTSLFVTKSRSAPIKASC
jgi:hypothetical protein